MIIVYFYLFILFKKKSQRKLSNYFGIQFNSQIYFQIIICMRNLNGSQIQSGRGNIDQNLEEIEKNQQLFPSNINQQPPLAIQLQNSPHIDKYNSFFRKIKDQSKQAFIQKLLSEGITYDPLLNNETATINQLKSSLNYEALLLQVRLGPFYIPITILNRSDRSPFHMCETIGRGAAGQILEATCNSHTFVIKCVKCTDYSSKRNQLLPAIQQLAMFKICSALEVGPRLRQYMGFDMVCYADCIEFAMQKCIRIQNCGKGEQNQIKQCLKLMHLLQIVHFDVKPANINFSPSFSKPVFLDFGFSRALSTPIGKMKIMLFIGTVGYCSEEMNQAYFSQEQKYIDPYYNDVIGLQRSLIVLKKQNGVLNSQYIHAQSYFHNYSELSNQKLIDSDKESEKQISKQQAQSSSNLKKNHSSTFKYVQEQLLYYSILSLLFTSKYEYITLSLQQQQILPNFTNKIINFINSLSPSSQIKSFYAKYIQQKSSYNDKLNHNFFKFSNLTSTDDRNFASRLSHLLNFQINLIDFNKKRGNNDFSGHKQRLMLGKSQFVCNKDYLLTLLEYIRFNHLKQSTDIKSRQQICRVYLETKPQKNYSFREIMEKTFLSLMEHCLKINFDACTRHLFSHIFQHICMLNILTLEGIYKIIHRISQTSSSLYAKVFFFIQIDRGLVWKERLMEFQKSERYLSTLHLKCLISNLIFKLVHKQQGLNERSKARILKYLPKYFYLKQTNFYTAANILEEHTGILSQLAGRPLTRAQKNWLCLNLKAKQCENNLMKDFISTRASQLQLQSYLTSNDRSYIQSYHLIIADYQYITYNEVFVAEFVKILEFKLGEYYHAYDFRLKILNMRSKHSLKEQKYYVQFLIRILQYIQKENTISNDLYRQTMKCYLVLSSGKSHLELFQPLQRAIDQNQVNFLTSISWILHGNSELFGNYHQGLLKLYLNYHLVRKRKFKNYSILKIINKFTESIPTQISTIDTVKMLYSCHNLKKALLWLQTIIYFQAKDYQMMEKIYIQCINLEQYTTDYTRLKKYLTLVFILQNSKQKRNKYAYYIYSRFNREMTVTYLFYHSVKIFVYILDYIIAKRQKKEQEVVQLFVLLSRNLEMFYHKNKLKIYTFLIQHLVAVVYLTLSLQISMNIFKLLLAQLSKHPYLALLIIRQGDIQKTISKGIPALARGLSIISHEARELVYNTYLRNILQSDCPLRKHKVTIIKCNRKDAWKRNMKMLRNVYCDRGNRHLKQPLRSKLQSYFRNYTNHTIVHFSNENPMFTQDI